MHAQNPRQVKTRVVGCRTGPRPNPDIYKGHEGAGDISNILNWTWPRRLSFGRQEISSRSYFSLFMSYG
jgi:hypothetical protein